MRSMNKNAYKIVQVRHCAAVLHIFLRRSSQLQIYYSHSSEVCKVHSLYQSWLETWIDANAALVAPVVVQFKCKPMLTNGTMTATTTNSEALDALGRASICAFHSPSSILFKSDTALFHLWFIVFQYFIVLFFHSERYIFHHHNRPLQHLGMPNHSVHSFRVEKTAMKVL